MTHKQNRSQKSQIAQLNCFKRQDVRHKHPNNTFFGDLAAMQSFYGCERWPRSTSENLNRCVQPRNESLLDPSRGSKAWFMEDVRSICCKNSLTSTRATLFVVRMWLKHHLLSLRIQYHGRLGRKPVTFFARKRAETSPKCKPLRD